MARLRKPPEADQRSMPAELLDPADEVWHNQALYLAYIEARGWDLPCSERLGVPAHPENRRRDAVGDWAVENGITSTPNFPDWHRIRRAFGSTERTVVR